MSARHLQPAPIDDLTPRERQVLEYVRDEVAAGRPFPSTRKIADVVGWRSTAPARDTLARLQAHGHVFRRRGPARPFSWELTR